MKHRRLILCLPCALLCACAATPRLAPMAIEPVPQPPPAPPTAGAIYRPGGSAALFEDVRARRVGDVVTIILAEQTDATKSASTSTSKDNAVDVTNPTLFGNPLAFQSGRLGAGAFNLGSSLESSKSFSGDGKSALSNKLSGNISATVVEVLPNGYLRIAGEKVIAINEGDEHIRLTGIVRPIDIQSDNTVPSTLVANAQITYSGNGVVADASDMGWLGKFFNSRWWPF